MQAVVATIVSDADEYAREVAGMLRKAGLEVGLDLTNQKINAKVREHSWRMCRTGGGRAQGGGAGMSRCAGSAGRRRRLCRWIRRCACLRPRRRHPIYGGEVEV